MAETNEPPDTVESPGSSDLETDGTSSESLESNQAARSDTMAPPTSPVDPSTDETVSGQPIQTPKPAKSSLLERLRRRVNIYTLLFILVLLLAASIILIAKHQNRHDASVNQLKTQTLSQSTLDQLANSDVTVGNNQSILKVQSSAVFYGQVLLRQNLQVAGNLQIGGTVSLNNITVGGTSQFSQVNINKGLAVNGTTVLQGTATVTSSLQVGGSGNFNGTVSAPQIVTSKLQLNGDLALTHHITTGGGQPSHSGGSALGSGGSASVSGSDTAGSININTGSGPAAGCFVTISFTGRYNDTPHVLVTPVGSAAGGLAYYVNRSSSNFSICDSSPPAAGQSFSFDYFVID